MLLVLVPVALATLVGLVVLWPGDGPSRAQQGADQMFAPGTTFTDGRVVSVDLPADCRPGEPCVGSAVVEVLGGAGEGDFQAIELPPEVVGEGVAVGDTVVLSRDGGAEGGPTYRFADYGRDVPLTALAVGFAICTAVVARLRGLAALLGLGFAFFILLRFVLPGILAESSPTLVTLVGSSAIMFVVLYLAHGFSARTTTALIGTLFGLALVAVLGSISVAAARLTGLTSEDTVTISTYDPTLDFSGLVMAGVVVAGLGVLNDVTITQASAIWQLKEASPDTTWGQLYRRGMAVGRDHIASTVYTLVFAYAGAALPLLIIFDLSPQPWGVTLTSSTVGEEVVRTLVGSIALVLAVPVTTAVGAFFATAAGTQAGAAPERRMTALRERFAR
jgi:uncharacterized membrane protein